MVDDFPTKSSGLRGNARTYALEAYSQRTRVRYLREGAPYEIDFEGDAVSPLAHVAVHAAVKGRLNRCLSENSL